MQEQEFEQLRAACQQFLDNSAAYKELYHDSQTGHTLVLSTDGRVRLVKRCSVYNMHVYEWLKSHRHPCVVRIDDAFEADGGLVVIEEFIQGSTLDQLLSAGAASGADGGNSWAGADRAIGGHPWSDAASGAAGRHSWSDAASGATGGNSWSGAASGAAGRHSWSDADRAIAGRQRAGMLSDLDRAHIFAQILSGVAFLHSAEPPIVHRDIKPANIMITDEGAVKIIDFDAAKLPSENGSRDTVLLGTEGSAAPEQYGFGASDTRTDIYGLGALLKMMFPDDEMMGTIVQRAMRLEPDERYQSVREMAKAFFTLYPLAADGTDFAQDDYGSGSGNNAGSCGGGTVRNAGSYGGDTVRNAGSYRTDTASNAASYGAGTVRNAGNYGAGTVHNAGSYNAGTASNASGYRAGSRSNVGGFHDAAGNDNYAYGSSAAAGYRSKVSTPADDYESQMREYALHRSWWPIPGFRTGMWYKMVLAVIGYAGIAGFSFLADFGHVEDEFLFRAALLFTFLTIVAMLTDWGPQIHRLPLIHDHRIWLRWLMRVVYAAIFGLVMFVIFAALAAFI